MSYKKLLQISFIVLMAALGLVLVAQANDCPEGQVQVTIGVVTPEGCTCDNPQVVIYGKGTFSHGATLCVAPGTTLSHAAKSSGLTGAWQTYTVPEGGGTLTEDRYCCVTLDVQNNTGCDCDATVDVYGQGNAHADGDKLCVPQGVNLSLAARASGIQGAWKQHTVANAATDTLVEDRYCCVTLDVQNNTGCDCDATVDVYGHGNAHADGDKLCVPQGVNLSLAARASGIQGAWKQHTVANATTDTLVEDRYCCVTLDVQNNTGCDCGATVDVYGHGNAHADGDKLCVPQGVNLSLAARASGIQGAWKQHTVANATTDTLVEDRYCCVTLRVNAPDCCTDATVDVYGHGNAHPDGDKLCVPQGVNLSLAARASGRVGAWKVHTVPEASTATLVEDRYCCMAISMPNGLRTVAKVSIYGIGTFGHGDVVCLPTSIDISWAIVAGGKSSCWNTKHVDCTALTAECKVHIVLPEGVSVYINGKGWFQNSAVIDVVPTQAYSYRLTDATKNIGTGWKSKVFTAADCCTKDWDLRPEYCEMEVQLPPGVWVYVNGSNKWYQNGAKVWLPSDVTISYLAKDETKNISTDWLTKKVDCTPLVPAYCEMEVQLPPGVWVYINGSNKWYQNGAKVWLPSDVTISYLAKDETKNISTDWLTKKVDCTPLKPEYCEMEVKLEAGVWSKVYINGANKWYQNGAKVWLPVGVTISYRAQDVNGKETGWQTKTVDCTALVPQCKVHIVLPEGTWIEIYGVGWLQNCAWIDVKPAKPYSYRLWNAAKTVAYPAGSWQIKTFAASDCGKDWDLRGDYCLLDIDLGGSDGYVEIYGVGWFQQGDDQVWLPKQATISYRQWNKAKTVAYPAGGWETKKVDCTPLVSEYCHLDIDLGGSDGYVEIYGVGWFQQGDDLVWLPKQATISYRQWNKAKTVAYPAGDWEKKDVDCTPLVSEYCLLDIDLGGSDGYVEIYGVGWFQQGDDLVWLPEGATISYRQWNKAQTVAYPAGGWETKKVDCTPLVSEYCHLDIDLGGSDGYVEIYGVGWFQQGDDLVWLPEGATISYRQWNKAQTVAYPAGGWETKKVDCTPLVSEYCHLDIDLGGSNGYVEIYGVGWFQQGDDLVWLPEGATISYRQWNNAKTVVSPSTGWKTKKIDCTPLISEYCYMKIVLTDPADGWVEISGVGRFRNGNQVWLPVCATIRYRVWNASQAVVIADWQDKHVDCSDLAYPKVTVTVTPGAPTWTKGAGVRYKGYNTGKEIFLGPMLPPSALPRTEAEYNEFQTVGQKTYQITFAFDKGQNEISTSITSPDMSLEFDFDLQGAPGCPSAGWDALEILVRDSMTNSGVALQNVVLDSFNLGNFGTVDKVGTPGWQNWTVTGFDFSQSFVVSADLVVDGYNGNESIKIEFNVGCLTS